MTVSITDDAVYIPGINFTEVAVDPTAPGTGHVLLYCKEGVWYARRSGGSATPLGGSVALAENSLAVGDGDGLLSALSPGSEGAVPTRQADGSLAEVVPTPGAGGDYPGNIYIQCMSYDSYVGTAPGHSVNNSIYGYSIMTQGSSVNTESVTWKLYLAAGTYSFRTTISKGSTGCIQEMTIGGVSLGTIDRWAGAPTYGTVWEVTGIAIPDSGLLDMVLTGTTRNGSSSGWAKAVGSMSIWRTS